MEAAAGASLEATRSLAPRLAAAAQEGEDARRVPAGISAELAEAGLYRLCVPAEFGGGEAEPRKLIEAIEALAVGDAAPAWCVAVCATAGMLAAYLPAEVAREIYGAKGSVAGGVFAPMGRAVADGDELTVSGRWRFASNIANCDWLMGGCIVFDGEKPRMGPGGQPDVRLVLMEKREIEVHDTWSVSGLRGTGSHDFSVAGLLVGAERSASLITDSPVALGALYTFPPFGLLAASIAGVALGTARGALHDLVELASAKTPSMSSRKLADRPDTQAGVARAEARLRAARAHLLGAIDRAWEEARADGAISLEARVGVRLSATAAVEAAAACVDDAYGLAGGSAIYEMSPLQRRFRDVHAATQHMLVGPATWELAGRALLGLELDDSQV